MFEPLGIRKMQIKATRYHYVPTRMTKVKTTDKAKCKKDVDQGELMYWWWEWKMVQPLGRIILYYFIMLNIHITQQFSS